jgi:hypothetical protein
MATAARGSNLGGCFARLGIGNRSGLILPPVLSRDWREAKPYEWDKRRGGRIMKAVVWHGNKDIRVETVPDPRRGG